MVAASAPNQSRRHRAKGRDGLLAAVLIAVVVSPVSGGGAPAAASPRSHAREVAALDAADLRLAAESIQAQALSSGALHKPVSSRSPAVVILRADEALIDAARRHDPHRKPMDTRVIMGAVPRNLRDLEHHRPRHVRRLRTRSLHRFTHSVPVEGAFGVGAHDGAKVAAYRHPDGVYVDPRLPRLPHHASIGEAALRSAMSELGQPYVWGGAGPSTYDCSGLVMHAYGHAGVRLVHHSATQWNEARLIPARDALPGDLIMYGDPIFHVGIYLGAGWMLNAPFTGHYVDVLPVWTHAAGVVRP